MIYYAHRGLSDHAPENTMAAFQMAVKAGAKAMELDVQRSKDGQIVVMHDFTLGRTNEGKGLLKDYSYDQLQKLDMGSWFDAKFAGEKMPLLEEIMEKIPQEVMINIEMKKLGFEEDSDFAQKVVDIIHKHKREVLVSSFDHHLLLQVQALDESIPLGLLYCSNLIDVFRYAKESGLNLTSINPSIEYVNAELVKQAHQQNIKVNVYTIHTAEEAKLLEAWGVDGIFVNTFDIVGNSL